MRALWRVYLSSRVTRASSTFFLRSMASATPYCIHVLNSSTYSTMRTCLFLSFRLRTGSSLSVAEMAKLDAFLRATPRLTKALVHTPARASDPYLDDGSPPQLVLRLYFAELPDLEAALSRNGHLALLQSGDEFPALADADITQQAMLVRPF